MADEYRIVKAQLPLLGGLGGHNLLVILDPNGNVVRELNGVATTPTGDELPIGFIPFYHRLQVKQSLGPHFYSTDLLQTSIFSGSEQDVLVKWNAAVAAANAINSKDLFYPPLGFGDNSNSVASTLMRVMGFTEPQLPGVPFFRFTPGTGTSLLDDVEIVTIQQTFGILPSVPGSSRAVDFQSAVNNPDGSITIFTNYKDGTSAISHYQQNRFEETLYDVDGAPLGSVDASASQSGKLSINISGQVGDVTIDSASIDVAPNAEVTIAGTGNNIVGGANSTLQLTVYNSTITTFAGVQLTSLGSNNQYVIGPNSIVQSSDNNSTLTTRVGTNINVQGNGNTVVPGGDGEVNITGDGNNVLQAAGLNTLINDGGTGTDIVGPDSLPPDAQVHIVSDQGFDGTVNVNDVVVIANGTLGIKLAETGELATSELPVQGPVEFVFNNQYIFDGVWGNEQVSGTGLGDNLWGQLGDDRLYGLDGTDFLSGGWGRDALYGGNHQDWLQGDWSEQFGAQGPQEQDYLDGGAGDDTLLGYGNDDVLLGGDDADQLLGDDYPQSPGARPVGKDYLDGGAGNDLLFAGLGEDVLFGGDGADELWGDNMPEGGWNDIITDQNGFLVSVFDPTGRPGRFTPDGGADYLDGGAGSDLLRGEGGDDVLLGGADNDFLFGDDQSTFTVTPGADWLDGGAGDDLLNGGRGTDALFGGEGNDLLFGDSADPSIGDDDTLDGGAGDDELQGGGGHDLLEGGLGNDFLLGQDGDDSLYGGEGLDELQGGVGADVLDGGADNDLVVGQAGNDTLFGGDGADELQGGEGDDDLAGETGDDFLLGDAGQDSLFGGDGADRLQGGIGDDLLVGDAGNDGLYGEDGDDTYIVDDANDRVIEAALGGNDTVASTVSYTLSRHVEQLILQGEDAITGNWYRLGKISIDRILMHA